MKKTLLLSGALFAATLAAAVTTNTASAADDDQNKPTSNADFTITSDGGDENGNTLYLSAEPSFTFDNASLKGIITKGQTLDDQKTDTNPKTLTVNDYTGDSKGWYVTAKLSDFTTEGNTDTITANSLNYAQSLNTDPTDPTDSTSPKNTTNFDPTATGSILLKSVSLKGTPSTVLAAADTYGQGVTSTTATGATLDLPEHANAKAAAYKANITWTLTQGQPATSPAGSNDTTGANTGDGTPD